MRGTVCENSFKIEVMTPEISRDIFDLETTESKDGDEVRSVPPTEPTHAPQRHKNKMYSVPLVHFHLIMGCIAAALLTIEVGNPQQLADRNDDQRVGGCERVHQLQHIQPVLSQTQRKN